MIIIFAAYFFAGKLGLKLAFENASATAVWAPTGIALVSFILLGYRIWPVILFGAFLINITTTGDIPTSIFIAFGNTAEGIIGAYLVKKYANGRHAFESVKEIFKFVVFAGLLSTIVSASIGVTSLAIRGLLDWEIYASVWVTWWIGDAVGAFLVAPLIILWANDKRFHFERDNFMESVAVILVLVVSCIVVFTPYSVAATDNYPISYILILPFVWIAFRFSQKFVTTVAFAVCAISIWSTLNGYGPFVTDSPNNSLLILQIFICILTILSISFAAIISRNNKIENKIRENEKDLRDFVENASLGLHWLGPDGKIIWANSRELEILGYDKDEFIGHHISEFHADQNKINNILSQLKKNKAIQNYEAQLICKDGSIRDVLISSNVLWENGKFKHTRCFTKDITDRKETEKHLSIQYSISKALAESQTFNDASQKVLQSICEGLGWQLGMIWIVDNKAGVLRLESAWGRNDLKDTDKGMTDPGRIFKKGIGLPGRVWKQNKAVWVPDVTLDNNFPRAPFALAMGIHAGLAFPVRKGNEVTAIIECFNEKILEPKEDLLEVLNASGLQIGNFLARKKAEEEKDLAQHTYKSLFESTLDGILIVDENGNYIDANESYCRMLKGTREQIIGQNFEKFMPPEMLPDAMNAFVDLKTKGYFKGEFPLMALDGSIVHAEWISRANFLPGMHFCVARDITERKISENKLISEYSFRAAIENSVAAGIAAVNHDGIQTYVNPALCKMLGWTEEELTGARPPYVYWPQEEIESISKAFSETLKGSSPREGFELRFCKKNGERFDVIVMVTAIRNNDDKSSGWLASVTDITEMKKVQKELKDAHDKMEERVKDRTVILNSLVEDLEKEISERKRAEEQLSFTLNKLKETQNELIHSEKLASLGRVSAGIAHEIRNPLANISALAQLLTDQKDIDPKLQKRLQFILENSNIANNIIKELLNLASHQNVNFRKSDIGRILNNLCENVKTRCEQNNIILKKNISKDLPEIKVNEEKLQTAFLNFISNSIEAMPDGGNLKVSAFKDDSAEQVIILFEDTGEGIEKENLDKILEPFFTTKSHGTGLGMSLAYNVIKTHCGKLNIESEVNRGTRIIVRLPINSDNTSKYE